MKSSVAFGTEGLAETATPQQIIHAPWSHDVNNIRPIFGSVAQVRWFLNRTLFTK